MNMSPTKDSKARSRASGRYVNAPVSIKRGERLHRETQECKNVAKAMVKTGIVRRDFTHHALGLNRAVFTMEDGREVEGYLGQPSCSQFVMYVDDHMAVLGVDTGSGVVSPKTVRGCVKVAQSLVDNLGEDDARKLAYQLYQRVNSGGVDAMDGSTYRIIDAMVRHTE